MRVSRRGFLKITGATTGGAILGSLGFSPKAAKAQALDLKIKFAQESTTICPYCGVGCSEIVSVSNGKIINIEGDPDHPINQGSLCTKGAALIQVANNERRMTKVLYRAPNSDKWEEKSWDWALPEIAKRIKKTRDDNWLSTVDVGGTTYSVNRTDAIANFGGGELDNEECYLLVKMARALGLVYLEHCARI